MSVKKVVGKVHLWLGLASGLVVFMVATTGCILAFQEEIKDLLRHSYKYVEPVTDAPLLSPSQLKTIAKPMVPGKSPQGVVYEGRNFSAIVQFYGAAPDYFYQVYVNPYTGKVLKVVDEDNDFFHIILHGHYYLWLPEDIGRVVVAYSTVIFVVMLLTGLVLWWPKKWSKSNIKKSFKIKWKAGWRRVNYDLHNVPGFYALIVALMLGLTGLLFEVNWFIKPVYWLASGGQTMPEYQAPVSDTTIRSTSTVLPVDRLWQQLSKTEPKAGLYIGYPEKASDALFAYVNHHPGTGTYYELDYYYLDQQTLKPFDLKGPYIGKFADANLGDKLRRMNYDIHTGAILSLPGKILAFIASLICASLPITGFVIWWGRRRKERAARPVAKLIPENRPPLRRPIPAALENRK